MAYGLGPPRERQETVRVLYNQSHRTKKKKKKWKRRGYLLTSGGISLAET
jgi:hypothetical protein